MLLNPAVRLAYPLIGSAASGAGVMSTLDALARKLPTFAGCARTPMDTVTRRTTVARYRSIKDALCLVSPWRLFCDVFSVSPLKVELQRKLHRSIVYDRRRDAA